MLQCLCLLQQIIVHHFFDFLMDGKNQILQAQVARAVVFLQIGDSIQALLYQMGDSIQALPHQMGDSIQALPH